MTYKSLFIFILFWGCEQTSNKALLIDTEIMKLHDEAMAKSSKVLVLKKAINNKIDTVLNSALNDSLKTISFKLYKADRMMLDWMHQYTSPNLNNDSAEKYLNKQLLKIKAVHEITMESISDAEAFLKNEK